MIRFPLLAVVSSLLAGTPAFAHKLNVEAGQRGDRLHVEAYYEDETPADDAKVTLLQGDTVVAEGKTDDRGVWSCPLPPAGTYTVKVLSVGHAATQDVKIDASSQEAGAIDPAQRAANTRIPWDRLGLGLGLILGLGVGWWLIRRKGNSPASGAA